MLSLIVYFFKYDVIVCFIKEKIIVLIVHKIWSLIVEQKYK